jgi:hypothetical protein
MYRLSRVLAASVIVLTALCWIGALDARPITERAATWAASPDVVLPVTLADMASYPTVYRRAAFTRLSPEQKSALWTEQLRYFLATETLSSAQRAVVNEALPLVAAEYYARPHTDAEKAKMASICGRAQALFDQRQKLAFGVIAYYSSVSESKLVSWMRSKKASVVQPFVANAAPTANCDCTSDTYCPDCSASSGCAYGTLCHIEPYSCGCLNWATCDGRCIAISPQ